MTATKPKTIYHAAVTYWTPKGRAVRYSKMIAGHTLSECEEGLVEALLNDCKWGRRKVGPKGYGKFSAQPFSTQIQTT